LWPGIGICQALLFFVALADGLAGDAPWRERLTRPITVLSIGLAAVLLTLDLAGINRGEVIRLWIFLACFFQIPAAYICARLEGRMAILLLMAVTILQSALGTAMMAFIIA
jgi:hypothetical protein